jgi:hypothetical protein
MNGTQNAAAALHDDAQLLAGDLYRVSGALSEIATCWRRAWQSRPELPLDLPLRLHDTTRQLAADMQKLAGADPGQPPDLALSVASRLSALTDDIASAQAMTCGPGTPTAGDAALWDDISAALERAGSQLPGLDSGHRASVGPVSTWPPDVTSGAGH